MGTAVITVANQKGGSGKSSVAMLLADALQRRGLHIRVVDSDPQASAWKWEQRSAGALPRFPVAVERVHGLTREEFARWLEPRLRSPYDPSRDLDCLIIDTPPRLDSEELFSALYVCDLVVVPFRPHVAYVDALEELVALVQKVDRTRARHGRGPAQCRALLNCFSGRRTSERVLVERAAEVLPWPILNCRLKDLVAFADAFNFRTSLYALPGTKEARRQIEALATEIGFGEPPYDQESKGRNARR